MLTLFVLDMQNPVEKTHYCMCTYSVLMRNMNLANTECKMWRLCWWNMCLHYMDYNCRLWIHNLHSLCSMSLLVHLCMDSSSSHQQLESRLPLTDSHCMQRILSRSDSNHMNTALHQRTSLRKIPAIERKKTKNWAFDQKPRRAFIFGFIFMLPSQA